METSTRTGARSISASCSDEVSGLAAVAPVQSVNAGKLRLKPETGALQQVVGKQRGGDGRWPE